MGDSFLDKSKNILFSYWLTLILFFLLGTGAAVATFIENDYGTSTARMLVYNHTWYEVVMTLSIINMLGIIYLRKMWKNMGRFLFHFSFVVMLIGAAMTRYVGFEGIMQIREGETTNKMISLEPYLQVSILHNNKNYYQEYQFDMSAIDISNDFSYTIPLGDKDLQVDYDSYTYAKKGKSDMGILKANVTFDGKTELVKLVGKRAMAGIGKEIIFGDTKVFIVYGSKPMELPFSIKLRDFQLDRYPGSMSPSSYASEVTLIDEATNTNLDYRIYMNNTLKHGHYQFFQSSYDTDELGTVLSVNNDPGKWPTYLGYFLLTLGLLMNFFDKKSRFAKLIGYIKTFNSLAIVAIASFIFSTTDLSANEKETNKPQLSTVEYLKKYRVESKEIAKKFGILVVQSNAGRMKPMDSLSREIVSKLTRKTTFLDMTPNQVVLGMLTNPDIWRNIKMIKIKTPKLKQTLGIDESRKYIAFSEVFTNNEYKLSKLVEEANALAPNKRGTFEKDILRLDERLNIAYMVYFGNLFKMFPKEPELKGPIDTKWYNPMDAINSFTGQNKEVVETMIRGFISTMIDMDYKKADQYLAFIDQYQRSVGRTVIPDRSKIESEILFNELNIFGQLTLAYVFAGIILFIVSFITVFKKELNTPKLNTFFFILLALLFAAHTFGMGHRWYISGHAPWSDTYESLVYIAWSAMFAGLVFFRKSNLALSATVVMAGVFMFTAHLTGVDPQITNLVPVLKSYWLTIHVSIITGSYGFLAIGATLGFMALLLFIVRGKNGQAHIDDNIRHITAINEAALIIGLAMLIVGNFLGGVWANESWGRYWGWDPKETWAWVAIIVYAFVLHLRFVPKLNTPYIFSVMSTLAFSSILMTYFGVNFYLSGMHSYATGDPVPIPTWVYVLTALVFVVIGLASRNRGLEKLKLTSK
jgi:cytochrome c-type biogenesis protein CcsB